MCWEPWESTTREEHRDLVHIAIQEVKVDMTAKGIVWLKARSDYEPLFSILDGLHLDGEIRYWIEGREAGGSNSDIESDNGQMSTGVETVLQMSDKT